MTVTVHNLNDETKHIQFVVIQARYLSKWIFVRHRDRSTWEMTGGHVEPGETPDKAARRELWEESGATEFELTPLCDYSVSGKGETTWGRFYRAEVTELGELPGYEICEITLRDEPPENLTYPLILPVLFEEVLSEKETV